MTTSEQIDDLFATGNGDAPITGETIGGGEAAAVPADAGTPDGEITPEAQAALDQLKAKNETKASTGAGPKGSKVPWKSVKDKEKERKARLAENDGAEAEIPDEIEGLTSGDPDAYAERQKEIAAAKAAGAKPKARKLTPAQKAKADADKAKEREKAAAAKAKEKEKAAAAKAKEKEQTAKSRKQEQAARRKEMEDARKKKLAEQKAARAAERAAKQTPDLIGRENKATQAAFAEDYQKAGPKTDRNPDGTGVRRAKSDRGDFAAGWIMAMRRVRRDLKRGETAAAAD